MNRRINMETERAAAHAKTMDGYIHLFTTKTIFDMDLVGKNLVMNGIDAVWTYPDMIDGQDERATLFVTTDQKQHALSLIATLDLTDFISLNDK